MIPGWNPPPLWKIRMRVWLTNKVNVETECILKSKAVCEHDVYVKWTISSWKHVGWTLRWPSQFFMLLHLAHAVALHGEFWHFPGLSLWILEDVCQHRWLIAEIHHYIDQDECLTLWQKKSLWRGLMTDFRNSWLTNMSTTRECDKTVKLCSVVKVWHSQTHEQSQCRDWKYFEI